MSDAFGGTCVYDEGGRHNLGTWGVLGFLIAGNAAIEYANLTDEQIVALKQTLSEQLNAQPILDIWVNPDLLGGLVVQVGDKVYDTSVRSRLENLRTHLMASGTHV